MCIRDLVQALKREALKLFGAFIKISSLFSVDQIEANRIIAISCKVGNNATACDNVSRAGQVSLGAHNGASLSVVRGGRC